jgi:hypothetical protein
MHVGACLGLHGTCLYLEYDVNWTEKTVCKEEKMFEYHLKSTTHEAISYIHSEMNNPATFT